MNAPSDLINGLFECVFGLLRLVDVRAIIRDKKIQGVSWLPVSIAVGWGFWNLLFYPIHHLWWSFWGGIFIVTTNCTWLWFVFKYRAAASKP